MAFQAGAKDQYALKMIQGIVLPTCSEVEREQKIIEALVDKTARQAFKSWAECNQEFVGSSPLLTKILQKAADIDLEMDAANDPVLLEFSFIPQLSYRIKEFIRHWNPFGTVGKVENLILQKKHKELVAYYEETLNDLAKRNLTTATGTNLIADYRLIKGYRQLGLIDDETAALIRDKCRQFLQSVGRKGENFLHETRAVDSYLPLIEEWDPEDLKKYFAGQDKEGSCPLHFSLSKVVHLLAYSSEDLTRLFSIQDRHGNTPLHTRKGFESALPLLDKLSTEQLKAVLAIKNKEGETVLHNPRIFKIASPLFEKSDQLVEGFLCIRDKNDNTFLHDAALFSQFLPFLKRQPAEKIEQFLSIQNKDGSTPLHHIEIFNLAWPLIEKFSRIALEKVLLSEDWKKSTPLHDSRAFETASRLIAHHKIDVSTYTNSDGLSPIDIAHSLSGSWIKKEKYSDILKTSLSEQQYAEQAQDLVDSVYSMWQDLKFGSDKGELSPLLLEFEGKQYSKEEVWGFLDIMLTRIQSKKIWSILKLIENKPQEVHAFYSEMLTNFRFIVDKLKEGQNPQEIAGFLFSVAETQIKGRCPTAYQGEIEQKALLYSDAGYEAMIDCAANAALQAIIEKVVASHFKSDSHAFRQLRYALGLAKTADPYSKITVETARKLVLGEFNFLSFLQDFRHFLPDDVPGEYLKMKTPDTYDSECVELIQQIAEKEEALEEEIQESLEKFLPQKTAKSVLADFKAFQAVEFPNPITKAVQHAKAPVQAMIEHAEERLKALDPAFKEVDVLQIFEEADKNFDEFVNILNKKIKKAENMSLHAWLQFRQKMQSQLTSIRKEVESALKFKNSMERREIADENLHSRILELYSLYESEIQKLAEKIKSEKGVVFLPAAFLSPSKALDDDRRFRYNKKYLAHPNKALIEILKIREITQKIT